MTPQDAMNAGLEASKNSFIDLIPWIIAFFVVLGIVEYYVAKFAQEDAERRLQELLAQAKKDAD